MKIRPAVADDLDAVKSIAEAAYTRYVVDIGQKPAPMIADFAAQIAAGHVSVVKTQEMICGFVVAYPAHGIMHLENIAIDPAHQGLGLGHQLVKHVEDMARSLKLAAVELYTNEKMTGNLNWYPAIGYSETSRRKEDGFNRVYFRKDL